MLQAILQDQSIKCPLRDSAPSVSNLAIAIPESKTETMMDVDGAPEAGPASPPENAMDVDAPASDQEADGVTKEGDCSVETRDYDAEEQETIPISDSESLVEVEK